MLVWLCTRCVYWCATGWVWPLLTEWQHECVAGRGRRSDFLLGLGSLSLTRSASDSLSLGSREREAGPGSSVAFRGNGLSEPFGQARLAPPFRPNRFAAQSTQIAHRFGFSQIAFPHEQVAERKRALQRGSREAPRAPHPAPCIPSRRFPSPPRTHPHRAANASTAPACEW